MADEQVIEQNDNLTYIQTIQELKDNSVDRKLYNKLKDERDMLVKTLANGDSLTAVEAEQVRSLAECRKDFMTKSKSQCEYMRKLLDLREAAIREGEPDPFVSIGHKVKPTQADYDRSAEVAEIYEECLEYAAGDDKVLINEIYRRMR